MTDATNRDRCAECGAMLSDHDGPEQHRFEDLADEIAHDLVAPPDDDASPAVVDRVMRYVAAAYAAAYRALHDGEDRDTASKAAEAALGKVL